MSQAEEEAATTEPAAGWSRQAERAARKAASRRGSSFREQKEAEERKKKEAEAKAEKERKTLDLYKWEK